MNKRRWLWEWKVGKQRREDRILNPWASEQKIGKWVSGISDIWQTWMILYLILFCFRGQTPWLFNDGWILGHIWESWLDWPIWLTKTPSCKCMCEDLIWFKDWDFIICVVSYMKLIDLTWKRCSTMWIWVIHATNFKNHPSIHGGHMHELTKESSILLNCVVEFMGTFELLYLSSNFLIDSNFQFLCFIFIDSNFV